MAWLTVNAVAVGWALVLVAAAGVFVQLTHVGCDTLRAVSTSEELRGRVIGMVGALGGLAAAAAVPLVGRLAATLGPDPAFYIGAAFCAVGAGAALAGGKREPAVGRRELRA